MIFSFLLYFLSLTISPNLPDTQSWNFFVFAQKWPPAACLDVPHGKCLIPKIVNDWSIHGLWPSSKKGSPSFCNHSWPFDPQLIKPLVPELEKKWPNIFANTSEFSFWKHEWEKHGTCAACLKNFNSEYKYFTHSLALHDRFDIFEFLGNAGINPSSEPQLLSDLEDAIQEQVNGTVKLSCSHHKEYEFPLLASLEICLDINLNVINCNKVRNPDCGSSSVLYLPFKKQTTANEI